MEEYERQHRQAEAQSVLAAFLEYRAKARFFVFIRAMLVLAAIATLMILGRPHGASGFTVAVAVGAVILYGLAEVHYMRRLEDEFRLQQALRFVWDSPSWPESLETIEFLYGELSAEARTQFVTAIAGRIPVHVWAALADGEVLVGGRRATYGQGWGSISIDKTPSVPGAPAARKAG
jgi:hypothetical protein